jgi:hypothetical protein
MDPVRVEPDVRDSHDPIPSEGWGHHVRVREARIARLEREVRLVAWGMPLTMAVLAVVYWLFRQ